MKTNISALGSQSTQTIKFPAKVAASLKNEATRSRQSIAEFLMQWRHWRDFKFWTRAALVHLVHQVQTLLAGFGKFKICFS